MRPDEQASTAHQRKEMPLTSKRQKRCRRAARNNTRTTRAHTRRCGGVAVSSKKRQRQSRRGGSSSSEDRRRHEREQREADAQKEDAHQKVEKEKRRTAKQKAKQAQDAAKEKRKAEKEAAKRADNGKKILESAKKSAKAFRKELHKQLFEDGDYAGKRVTEAQERQKLLELCDKMGLKKPPQGMKKLYEYVREKVNSGGWLRALGTLGMLGGVLDIANVIYNNKSFKLNIKNLKANKVAPSIPTTEADTKINIIANDAEEEKDDGRTIDNVDGGFKGAALAGLGGLIYYVSLPNHHIVKHISTIRRNKNNRKKADV